MKDRLKVGVGLGCVGHGEGDGASGLEGGHSVQDVVGHEEEAGVTSTAKGVEREVCAHWPETAVMKLGCPSTAEATGSLVSDEGAGKYSTRSKPSLATEMKRLLPAQARP